MCLSHYLPPHQPFCFSLSTQSPFSQFTCFTYIHKFFSLNMSEYVSFCFMFHVPDLIVRLSRAIHQHIFSRPAGTQYTDCITYLAITHFVLVCTNYPNFASLLIFSGLNMSVYVLFPMFHILPSQRAHIGPAERTWATTQKSQPYYLDVQRAIVASIRLPAHIHVFPTLSH